MKTIQLTQGKVTMVDDEDYEYLMQWKWFAYKHHRTFYAVRSDYTNGKQKQKRIRIHNVLLGEKVDHIDHDGLNNQRSNLRNYTGNQNCYNRSAKINGSSKYLGVFKQQRRLKNGSITIRYVANIRKDGKLIRLGQYKDEEIAARVYDAKAMELWGEFANPNFKIV